MTPEEFRDQVLETLNSDNAEQLDRLVKTYEPLSDGSIDSAENEVLVALGKFGCSGRTSRYKPFVDTLIEKGIQPDLTSCAYLGLIEQAKSLVEQDPNAVNSQNREGSSPLHAAAERGDPTMVRWLCDVGADPRHGGSDGELPIVRAMHAGPWKASSATEIVDFLAPLCGMDQQLWFAAGRGDIENVKSILNRGSINIDEPDEAGETPLFHACHNNQPETVGLLLDAGADPNLPTASGDTPLATACLHSLSQECDPEIISMLLEAGANETIEAAVVGENLEFIRSYSKEHSHISASDVAFNPLYYAVHTGRARSLETLIELGARPDDDLWDHIVRIFTKDKRLLQRLRAATGRKETQTE